MMTATGKGAWMYLEDSEGKLHKIEFEDGEPTLSGPFNPETLKILSKEATHYLEDLKQIEIQFKYTVDWPYTLLPSKPLQPGTPFSYN